MRLIDADAYAAEMRKRQDACNTWKSEQNDGSEMYARAEQALVTFVEAWATLEKQPTVDAIPVEWLKKQRESHAPESIKEIYSAFTAMCIDTVLALWREDSNPRKRVKDAVCSNDYCGLE